MPAKRTVNYHSARYLSEGYQSGIKQWRIQDSSANRSRDAFHGRVLRGLGAELRASCRFKRVKWAHEEHALAYWCIASQAALVS
jgi:hypothetical protein